MKKIAIKPPWFLFDRGILPGHIKSAIDYNKFYDRYMGKKTATKGTLWLALFYLPIITAFVWGWIFISTYKLNMQVERPNLAMAEFIILLMLFAALFIVVVALAVNCLKQTVAGYKEYWVYRREVLQSNKNIKVTKQNSAEANFHKKRRLFAIIDNNLYIAPAGTADSHLEWLIAEDLLKDFQNTELNGITRGYVSSSGLYFYEGDFELTTKAESDFFSRMSEIIIKLNVDTDLHLYGGFSKGEVGKQWTPIKDFGVIDKISI